MNIYVGNLSPGTSERKIRKAFELYGVVGKISLDSQTREDNAYLFCFIEMPFDNQALIAIRELDGKLLDEHILSIKESGVPA